MDPIGNDPALVQIMAWRQIGDKPLFGPMLTRFTDAYISQIQLSLLIGVANISKNWFGQFFLETTFIFCYICEKSHCKKKQKKTKKKQMQSIWLQSGTEYYDPNALFY